MLSLNRRRAVQLTSGLSAGLLAQCSWFQQLADASEGLAAKAKAVVLLWMDGGPSTIDLWDLKPNHANGGDFAEIATSVPGLKISQHLSELSKQADDLTVIRSMTSREGDHQRASFFAHTGYVPQAGIDFPTLGSLVASESPAAALPNFVSILPPRRTQTAGNGFLPPRTAPVQVGENAESLTQMNVKNLDISSIDQTAWLARKDLLQHLNNNFESQQNHHIVSDLAALQQRALGLTQPQIARMFDVSNEDESIRSAYGLNLFGQGCLLARRLIENGVRFVEVTLDGWDTHQDNFSLVRGLSQTLDRAYAALMIDLRRRGLLDSTLILCMGEFGRTPKINANAGRDHWPCSWSVVLAGGGLGQGAVVGATSADGLSVAERPVTVPDLLATVGVALGIDPRKQNESNVGRPIRFADPEAQIIRELL